MHIALNRAERRPRTSNRNPIEPIGVSPIEAADIRGSRSTIYRLLAAGELLAVKRGTTTLVLLDSIRAYQANLPPATFGRSKLNDAA